MILLVPGFSPGHAQKEEYPSAKISGRDVVMKLYLPDTINGYYRATRFDWSGIICSLEYRGHQYFGEWKESHDPHVHEDITGPAESYGNPGLGYNDAAAGGEFIRIGVGILEKPGEPRYVWDQTYRILDHGTWNIRQGSNWIEFRHEVKSKTGWGYIYKKRIELMNDRPGFSIRHSLRNTGRRIIETDQYNHNFFVFDNEITGPGFQVRFPFNISSENDTKGITEIRNNTILFSKELTEGSIWMALKGFTGKSSDHHFEVINTKTGAGIRVGVDKPLYRLVFWAARTTLCPENFIYLKVEPGREESWNSRYELLSEKNRIDLNEP